jgi:hypothetical protein
MDTYEDLLPTVSAHHIFQHNGELIVPHNGGWVVAQGIDTDSSGDFFWIIASPPFDTVEQARQWIDLGCPEGTEGLDNEDKLRRGFGLLP